MVKTKSGKTIQPQNCYVFTGGFHAKSVLSAYHKLSCEIFLASLKRLVFYWGHSTTEVTSYLTRQLTVATATIGKPKDVRVKVGVKTLC